MSSNRTPQTLALLVAAALAGCGGPERRSQTTESRPRPAPAAPAPKPAPAPADAPAPSAPAPGAPVPSASAPAAALASGAAGGDCVPWTAADDALAAAARDLRGQLEGARASLPATLAIDDSGPSWNATFAAPDADAERAWRAFRRDLREELGLVRGISFVDPGPSSGATHLLTARLDESADRSIAVHLELVDMTASRIVWKADARGKIAR